MKRLASPPPTANCRPAPQPRDKIEAVNRYHHYLEERELRRTFHISLDEALGDTVPKGVVPSRQLYRGELGRIETAWENRWWTARLLELGFFPIAELLNRLGRNVSCQRKGSISPERLLAWTIGSRIHRRIQQTYRAAYPDSEVSLDNRVHFGRFPRTERISTLASRDPSSVYGALNFSFAGQRSDIIDLTRHEMWEIKPAAMASTAVLQLWGYLDNYEVARVFDRYARKSALAPIESGVPTSLSRKVTERFTLSLGGRIDLIVQPFVVSRLPGLILYTLKLRGSRQPNEAAAAIAAGRVQLQQMLTVAGRSAQQQMEAEIAFGEAGQYIATGVALTCLAVEVALLTGGTGLAAGGGAATTEAAAGQVISLAARRAALDLATREATREVAKRAAGIILVAAGSELFEMPTEALGLSLDTGMDVGVAGAEVR